ncbi:MAG: hypothetical protein LBU69_00235 [Deltaproteobacteria bacterium]|jgi:hypothetical protein|nr:hypothetical protein [Deltaproteobacteria bacterium]
MAAMARKGIAQTGQAQLARETPLAVEGELADKISLAGSREATDVHDKGASVGEGLSSDGKGLPGDWRGMASAGEVLPRDREARENASGSAIVVVEALVVALAFRESPLANKRPEEPVLRVLLHQLPGEPCLRPLAARLKGAGEDSLAGLARNLARPYVRPGEAGNSLDAGIEQLLTYVQACEEYGETIVRCAYLALTPFARETGQDNLAWVDLGLEFSPGVGKATGLVAINLGRHGGKYPRLAHGLGELLLAALERIQRNLCDDRFMARLMPQAFTIRQLQSAFELVQGKKILAPAFRRVMAPRLEETSEWAKDKKYRPSRLFMYKNTN